jgi:hypothetical protein
MIRKALNYFFLLLGLVYIISALVLLFGPAGSSSYEAFFGWELSTANYILYKLFVGSILIVVAVLDMRKSK